jgi:hypothetical protein
LAIVAGLKELDELEQSEGLFDESDFEGSSDSDNEENSKLTISLEDINYELKKRAKSTANNDHQTELPPTTRYED